VDDSSSPHGWTDPRKKSHESCQTDDGRRPIPTDERVSQRLSRVKGNGPAEPCESHISLLWLASSFSYFIFAFSRSDINHSLYG
jgi:hypothetical protein